LSSNLGATPAEWGHLDLVLGLGGNLLPVVCDPNATPSPTSKVKKFGKIPSAYDKEGRAFGLSKWAQRDILSNEVALWRQDPRLGICVRTGSKSGVYAIDVDIEDEALSDTIDGILPLALVRARQNSNKFLLPIEIQGAPHLDKRVIKTDHGIIEFLADGQQFVAVGTHPSGERYHWGLDGLPRELRLLTLEEFESLWSRLAALGTVAQSRPAAGAPDEGRAIEGAEGGTLTSIGGEEYTRLVSALMHPRMLADAVDNDFWSEVGYALISTRLANAFFEFSRNAPKYDARAAQDWWDAHKDQTPRTDYRHIFTLARQRGWGATADTNAFAPVVVSVREGTAAPEGQPHNPLDIEKAPLPRPRIQVTESNEPEVVTAATSAITSEVYKQANMLARVGRPDELDDGVEREGDYRSILRVTPAYLRILLGTTVDFYRYDGRAKDLKRINCPADIANMVLGMGDWPRIRALEAIARAPFMRADGTVCDVGGYDARSRTILLPNATFPVLPQTITREMALDALEVLLTPFREFPHANAASGSAFIAHILTEAARSAIRTAPMFWYTAPDAGTGKTLLSEMPASIVHGVQPAIRPWVSESEEVRKTLFASLLAGDRSIMFDNVPSGHKARSAELCAFLTSPIWADRKLGASEVVKIPNRSVLSASGNNVTPVSDLARRSIVVRLDANTAERKQRRFQIRDLRAYVAAHRVELLMAALTILLGWQQNQTDNMPVPLPSFEDWSRFVREPLIWLGMTDPVETQSEETDDESMSLSGVFEKLGSHFGSKDFTATSIRDFCSGFSDTDGSVAQLLIAAGCTDTNSPLKIGYWLRDCRDKIAGGYKLVRHGRDKSANYWLFKPVNGNEDLI
jgi:hypothetical protein